MKIKITQNTSLYFYHRNTQEKNKLSMFIEHKHREFKLRWYHHLLIAVLIQANIYVWSLAIF